LAYSGDTDYCSGVVELASEADLLILECSFPNEHQVTSHLTPSLAGQIAAELGCRRLVLTHLYPICDDYDILGQCQEAFAEEIIVAGDLISFFL